MGLVWLGGARGCLGKRGCVISGRLKWCLGGMQCRVNNNYRNSPYTNIEFGRDIQICVVNKRILCR